MPHPISILLNLFTVLVTNTSRNCLKPASLSVFSLITIFACSSTEDLSKSQFSTRITASGLKHFELRKRFTDTRQGRAASVNEQVKQARQDRARNPERIAKQLRQLAAAHLEANGYCRDGFWVMNVEAYGPVGSLRGECNEKATEQDRQRYRDTIAEW